ncbi:MULTISPECIES: molybdopterin-binding protein [unclassified Parafrankia]|uniref:TOBE domain-containing protein n=1 Tax=unclassified Parafrankia TaxID=2994368 RepID=UPI000DD37A8E|nr:MULTISPECIES: TOBE domain-containing protein [unclassified Parafrankia]TCJ33242.1 adenylate kinase [Parafrankia sp. BMG5.11]
MTLSIRNRLAGTVADITDGAVMGTVRIALANGDTLTSAVTMDAIKDVGIGIGSAVEVLVKSTDVSLATGETSGLTIRNRLGGTLVGIDTGGAMALVRIDLGTDIELTAAITRAAVDELKLAPGLPVTALIKSTEVAFSAL